MTGLLPGLAEDPDQVVARARAEHQPVRTFCLISGGNDSTVLAHRMRDHYDELAHVDTGTALPGVREFVVEFSRSLGRPLQILDAGDAFRELVLGSPAWWAAHGQAYRAWRAENQAAPIARFNDLIRAEHGVAQHADARAPHGFPGPAGHQVAYTRLKERQIERLVASAKAEHGGGRRMARVMLLTGTRRDESARRARNGKAPYRRVKAQVWCNPLVDWTNAQMREYRREHQLPESDVAALLHRSGECNCGAFAAPGERHDLEQLFPEFVRDFIEPIEAQARALGIPACRWGERPHEAPAPEGPMCSDCQLRLEGIA